MEDEIYLFKDNVHNESSVGTTKFYYRVIGDTVTEIIYNIMDGSYTLSEKLKLSEPHIKARVDGAVPSTRQVFAKKKKAAYTYLFDKATR